MPIISPVAAFKPLLKASYNPFRYEVINTINLPYEYRTIDLMRQMQIIFV